MPSASTAKLEKQASTEAVEPIKQGIIIIEHKIRNLEKRKARLDGYKALQKSGKELTSDQLCAVSKFDEVVQSLEFARELCKQFTTISVESAKQQKKQARKEALERTQQEIAKVKEILVIQDVLTNMGQDTVRDDFLTGNNGAKILTDGDLQKLDDLFVEVSPKHDIEEGVPPFSEQLQKAAEHLVNLVDGKAKEVVGTTYGQLKEQIISISTCGYFDQGTATAVPEEAEVERVPIAVAGQHETVAEDIVDEEEPVTDIVPSETFQSMDGYANVQHQHVVEPTQHTVETAGLYISQRPVNDVLSNVMNSVTSSFNFIQESELETEVITPTPPPTSALPIPTQTFTNANYAAPPVNVSPVVQQPYPPQTADIIYTPIPMPPQNQQPQHMSVAQPQITVPEPQPQAVYNNPATQTFVPQNQPLPAQQQYNNQTEFQHSLQSGDWSEATEPTTSDWALESAEAGNWQNNDTNNDWSEQQNDGFVPAGGRVSGNRGYGRGGRSGDRPRGRDSNYSGQRGNRGGNYNQNGRGGGGNYYRNNNEGGNNYYQNGYQNRGDGERGYREGGYNKRGGSRGGGGGGAPRQDRGERGERGERGGPRPGGRGGNQRGGRGGGGGMGSRHQ